jgi:hypothetical protein
MHDFIEAQGRLGVGTGQFMHPAGVPVEEAHTWRPVPFCFWVAKILTGCQQPGDAHGFGECFLQRLSKAAALASGLEATLLTQTLIENARLQESRRHPLTVNGIEAAKGIAKNDQSPWKARHPLVVTPPICREPVYGDRCQRLCILDDLINGSSARSGNETVTFLQLVSLIAACRLNNYIISYLSKLNL